MQMLTVLFYDRKVRPCLRMPLSHSSNYSKLGAQVLSPPRGISSRWAGFVCSPVVVFVSVDYRENREKKGIVCFFVVFFKWSEKRAPSVRTSGIWARGLGCANPTSSMRYEVCVCVCVHLSKIEKIKKKEKKRGLEN